MARCQGAMVGERGLVNEGDIAACYHCGGPVPEGTRLRVFAGGYGQPVCCAGCEAVASAILGEGLDADYRMRQAPEAQGIPKPDGRNRGGGGIPAPGADDFDRFDVPEGQLAFVCRRGAGLEAVLLLEGVRLRVADRPAAGSAADAAYCGSGADGAGHRLLGGTVLRGRLSRPVAIPSWRGSHDCCGHCGRVRGTGRFGRAGSVPPLWLSSNSLSMRRGLQLACP